jgi:acyl-ACP thioesterase
MFNAQCSMDKVGRYEFMAEPFHCDFSGRLFMGHLGNHMLNAADFHSSARGFGMKYLMTIHRSWVLSRLAIEMKEMPKQYTRFNVETWVESAMRYFTSRNFAVIGNDGRTYGYGRSIWAMIDTETRQPTDILSTPSEPSTATVPDGSSATVPDGSSSGSIKDWIVTDKSCPIDKGGRVKMTDTAEIVRTIDTYYNDVDINGHINSVKYIEHVLDLWPLEWYRDHAVRRFEIAYVAEAHAGDKLSFYMEKGTGGADTVEQEYCVRIVRSDGTECCRSKVVFRQTDNG